MRLATSASVNVSDQTNINSKNIQNDSHSDDNGRDEIVAIYIFEVYRFGISYKIEYLPWKIPSEFSMEKIQSNAITIDAMIKSKSFQYIILRIIMRQVWRFRERQKNKIIA